MRVSTDRIESALRGEDAKDHLVAQRVLATPQSWHSWELEHSGLMRVAADCTALRHQAAVLKTNGIAADSWHGAFEYLKNRSVRGSLRTPCSLIFIRCESTNTRSLPNTPSYVRKACKFLVYQPCRHRSGS